jgi:hypothetical protein
MKDKLFLNSVLGGVYFMQKCQISIFILDPPPSGSLFGVALVPQGDLGSKKGIKQFVLRIFFLGGVYLMQKCQISIFIFDPPSGSPFGETLVPQGDLGSKNVVTPKVLRI